MNTLKLRVVGAAKGCGVFIDGEQMPMRKARDGGNVCVYQTDSDTVELSVVKISELSGGFWFFWAIFFFIISCFGIFSPHYDKRCVTVNYKIDLTLTGENSVRLDFNRFADGQEAIACSRDCTGDERENYYGVDLQAKKRFKILTLVEVFLWIALLVGGGILVVKLIIG